MQFKNLFISIISLVSLNKFQPLFSFTSIVSSNEIQLRMYVCRNIYDYNTDKTISFKLLFSSTFINSSFTLKNLFCDYL